MATASSKSLEKRKLDEPANQGGQGRLLSLYQDPTYADIAVFAGTEKQCFKLHRAVITHSSGYFKAACKACFEEGQNREVHLEEIEPDVFESIVIWMYGGEYKLDKASYKSAVIFSVYAAADYLQIPKMREDILNALAAFWEKDESHNIIHDVEEEDPYKLLQRLCSQARSSEWPQLRGCTKAVVAQLRLSAPDLVIFSKETPGNSFMLALLVEFYQNELMSLLCYPCQNRFRKFNKGDQLCRVCGRECTKLVTVLPEDLK
ncbi:hypothetical protein ABW20_dc0107609 [Dactylellina cionopaga]|nr:hypothetical protein ABW20_dc0107609 [Dactylellina cionopaga]